MNPKTWTYCFQPWSEAHLQVQDELQCGAVIREVAVYHTSRCKKPHGAVLSANYGCTKFKFTVHVNANSKNSKLNLVRPLEIEPPNFLDSLEQPVSSF